MLMLYKVDSFPHLGILSRQQKDIIFPLPNRRFKKFPGFLVAALAPFFNYISLFYLSLNFISDTLVSFHILSNALNVEEIKYYKSFPCRQYALQRRLDHRRDQGFPSSSYLLLSASYIRQISCLYPAR